MSIELTATERAILEENLQRVLEIHDDPTIAWSDIARELKCSVPSAKSIVIVAWYENAP